MERVLAVPLAVLNRVRQLRWRLALRYLTARYGMRLELELGHGIRLADVPRLKIVDNGTRGGTLRIRLGDHVQIGTSVEIETSTSGTNVLELGSSTQVHTGAHLKLADGAIRVGEASLLRDHIMMKSSGELVLGPSVTISYAAIVHCSEAITLERGVGIADKCTIVDSEHLMDHGQAWFEVPVASKPIFIGHDSIVHATSTVRMGTVIGHCSSTGANSVIGGEFPPYSLIVGAPAKLLRRLGRAEDDEVRETASGT